MTIRCWTRPPCDEEYTPHVIAWYLLDSGTFLMLSDCLGLQITDYIRGVAAAKLIEDLETNWLEVTSFVSLQIPESIIP